MLGDPVGAAHVREHRRARLVTAVEPIVAVHHRGDLPDRVALLAVQEVGDRGLLGS
jgi:hypothetical protein